MKTVLLGDIAEINAKSINRNYHFERIKYIDVASVEKGNILVKTEMDFQKAPSRARRVVRDNDILISTVRPSLRHYAFVPKAESNLIASTGFATVSGMQNQVDSKFLYYYLTRDETTNYLAKIADDQASTFPAFRPEILASLKVSLPELEEQKKIGNHLYSIDEKIELNRKMNETLEQIGQILFKHYFIDNLEAKSWPKGKIADLCDQITNGSTPRRSNNEYWDGGTIPWVKSGELHDCPIFDTSEKITEKGLVESSCRFLPKNSVLMAIYAAPTVGQLGIAKTELTTNQAITALVAKEEVGYGFIYFLLKSLRGDFNNVAVGAAQQNISKELVENFSVVIPPPRVLANFKASINSILDMSENSARETDNLTNLRDSLLPRLISGKIKV